MTLTSVLDDTLENITKEIGKKKDVAPSEVNYSEIIKLVKSTAEETRIKMRRQRNDVNKLISAEIDKDLKFKMKDDLQKKVDQFNDSMDRLIEDKIKDLSS